MLGVMTHFCESEPLSGLPTMGVSFDAFPVHWTHDQRKLLSQQCNPSLAVGKIHETEASAGVPDLVRVRGAPDWENDPKLGRHPRVVEFALLVALNPGAWGKATMSGGMKISFVPAYRRPESLLEWIRLKINVSKMSGVDAPSSRSTTVLAPKFWIKSVSPE